MMAERARPPDPAKLRPIEVICDRSMADWSTSPPAVTTDPPLIEASTVLVLTFPHPVAFTATAPDPATPAVSEMIPALD